MKTVKLVDSASYGVGDFDIKKGETQIVHDDMLFMKLVDLGIFAEFPTTATYWVKSNQSRYIKYIDDAMQIIGLNPVRVTRRVFTQLPFHEGKLQRVYPYELMQQNPEHDYKIIVTRDQGMGDVLLTTDVVREIREQFPNVKIDYATLPQHRCLLEENPDIAHVFSVGDVNPFDYDFDLYLPRKSETSPEAHSKHRVDIYADEFGLEMQKHRTRFVLRSEEREEGERLLCAEGFCPRRSRPRLVLQPAGSGTHRSLSMEARHGVVVKAKEAGWDVVVYGQETGHFPWEIPGVFNACGKLRDLRQVGAVIAACDILCVPDSGGYHMAAALDPPVPAVAVFTTINPDLRTRYYPQVHAIWVGGERLSCSPCNDRIICAGRLDCVNLVTSDIIFDKLKEVFETCRVIAF